MHGPSFASSLHFVSSCREAPSPSFSLPSLVPRYGCYSLFWWHISRHGQRFTSQARAPLMWGPFLLASTNIARWLCSLSRCMRRRQSGGKQTASLKRGTESPVRQISDERETPIRTDEQLAKLAGTSRDTIRKARQTHFENELHISYTRGHKKVTHRCFYNTLKHKQVNQIYGLTC